MDGGSLFMHSISSGTTVQGGVTRWLDGHPEVDAYAPRLDHSGLNESSQPVTPACFWRGSSDLNESTFPPEACGNDDPRISRSVATSPVMAVRGNGGGKV